MDSEGIEDSKEQQTLPQIEDQASDVEMSEKYSSENAEGDQNLSTKGQVKDVEDAKEDEDSDGKKSSERSNSASKDSEASTSSDQIKTKRGKSKVQKNEDSGITMSKSDESSDDDSSKRQKMSETQSDSEIAECSGSNSDFSFRKLKSRVKNRYYRVRGNTEEEEETGETSTAHKSEADGDDKSKSDSDADNFSFEHDDAEEREQANGERSCDPPEEDSGPQLETRGADDSNEWTTASEEEPDVAALVMKKKKPKSKWFVIQELTSRQMGNNPQFPSRFYGSLQAVRRLELKCKLNEHQGCVNALSFNQKGNLLSSASDDLTVTIWDWSMEKKQASFVTGHRSNVFQVKWMPLDSENLMVTCARDGQVRLLELPVGRSRKIASHHGSIHKLAMHKEMPHVILSCGEDAKILSIDVREAKPSKLLIVREEMQEVQLYSIHSNPLNSNEFCVGGRTQAVRVYDRRKISAPLYKLCPSHLTKNKQAHVTSCVYNYNGTEVLASYNDEDIYLFDTLFPHPTGDFAHKYQGHRNNNTVKGVNFFGPKSEHIVSGSDCGNIFIWDKDTEAIVKWMPGDELGVVNVLEPHPFVPVLATCGLDYDVKVWVPSCEDPPAMNDLAGCVMSNIKNRAQELDDDPDAFDGQMLWILLRRIRESERMRRYNLAARRTRNADRDLGDEDLNESSSDHNSSNNSESLSDDDNEPRLQCSPS